MEYMFADPAFRAFILMAQRRPLALCGNNVGVAEAHTEPPATTAPLAITWQGQVEQAAIMWEGGDRQLAITWQGQAEQAAEPVTSRNQAQPSRGASSCIVGRGSNRGRRGPPPQILPQILCQDIRLLEERPANSLRAPAPVEPAAQPPANLLKIDVATNTDPLGDAEWEDLPDEPFEPTPEMYPGWKEALVMAVKEHAPRRGIDGRRFQNGHLGKVVQPPRGGVPYLVAAKVDINSNPGARITSWAMVLEALIRRQSFTFTRNRLGNAEPFSSRCLKANAGQKIIISLRPLWLAADVPG